MEISPLTLSILLISSFLWGGIVGVINDINKMIRVFLCDEECFDRHKKMLSFFKLEKKKRIFPRLNKASFNVLIFIQDLFSVLIATLGLILLNYYYNDGYFRFFTLLAVVLGFVIYYFTLGRLIRAVSEPIVFLVRCIIITVVRIAALPIGWLFTCVKKLARKLFVKCKKSIEKNRNLRYNNKRRKHIVMLSECGFIINDEKRYGMRINFKNYFEKERSPLSVIIRFFVLLFLVFSIVFFLWSVMKYNRLLEEQKNREVYISQLNEKIDELEYLVEMPLDDEYKIRMARERLGMCFPDEIIFYTDVE